MSQTFEFYDERAKTAAAEAEAAMLDNVRDRALRSEAAWRQLANRAQKTERDRAIRNAKAAETAEENRALLMAAAEHEAG
jgi:hypothetical protein